MRLAAVDRAVVIEAAVTRMEVAVAQFLENDGTDNYCHYLPVRSRLMACYYGSANRL
jgi:hypothetical protein